MPLRLRTVLAATPLYVCPRCRPQLRRTIIHKATLTLTTTTKTTKPHTMTIVRFYSTGSIRDGGGGYAHLTNRALIRLQGLDVVEFLNGLLPARLTRAQGEGEGERQSGSSSVASPATAPARVVYTAFLSAKGRVLYDAFVYVPQSPEGVWYVEVDAAVQAGVFTHLKKHKLRSKFKLEKVGGQEMGVYYVWPGAAGVEVGTEEGVVGGQDTRPLMGTRFLADESGAAAVLPALEDSGAVARSVQDYTIHRMLSGHAEGPKELIANSALPQESNIDFDGGIDFHKGCYLGQELTIRTHHTGIVRKRILPCQISPRSIHVPSDQQVPVHDASADVPQPPAEANISKLHAKGRAGRSTGKWLGGVGNIGLALCRLEAMTNIQLTSEGTTYDPEGEFAVVWEDGDADIDGKTPLREIRVKPFVPQWMRQSIEAGIKARSDRSKRRKQDEEDEDEDIE